MIDKFTDQELIKAFKDTIDTLSKRDCLIVPKDGIENLCFGLTSVLDLINRQQVEIKEWERVVETWQELHEKDKAEIERLHKEVDRLSQEIMYNTNTEKIEAEAIKKLVNEILSPFEGQAYLSKRDLENIVKSLAKYY